MKYSLESLNKEQQDAVEATDSEVLVIAGAGSGKTKVLINRIAYLLQNGVALKDIMAVTFTNKAAKEMILRLGNLVNLDLRSLWIGTFHGICNRFLRIHYQRAGISRDFQILDTSEQTRIIKNLLANYGLANNENYSPKRILSFISSVKESASRNYANHDFSYDKHLVKIAYDYDIECKKLNALDFDDLLLTTYEIFVEHEDLRNHYQQRFSHILIDEFQDTNTLQYSWLKLLHTPTNNIFAVGDDDQSIYGFRGAQVGNIRDYVNSYEKTRVIRLEQNYRSSGNILNAANALIKNNVDRLGKDLWTNSTDGEKIKVYSALNERDEAGFIGESIKSFVDAGGDYKDIGVLYRSNAQSQALETNFKYMQIPYKIYGGLKFYSREEIKNALAYMRIVFNTEDDLAFERVVNMPKRGVGDASLEKIAQTAEALHLSYWQVVKQNPDGFLRGKALSGVEEFIQLIENAQAKLEDLELGKLVELLIKDSGLLYLYEDSKDIKLKNKAENLIELINAAQSFSDLLQKDMQNNPTLMLSATQVFDYDFNQETQEDRLASIQANQLEQTKQADQSEQTDLEKKNPLSAIDISGENSSQNSQMPSLSKRDILYNYLTQTSLDSDETNDTGLSSEVQLMTLHNSKGLEFPLVFICGMEEGLFPHDLSLREKGLDEERRLCYVGITRAMQKLVLTHCESRVLFGEIRRNMSSRFLDELPQELLDRSRVRATQNIDYGINKGLSYGEIARQNYIQNRRKNVFRPKETSYASGEKGNGAYANFQIGQLLVHKNLGEGVLMGIEGSGDKMRVIVNFAQGGTKTLLAKIAFPEIFRN